MTGVSSGVKLSPRERLHRIRARSWVIQILYAWESKAVRPPLDAVMEETFQTRRVASDRHALIRGHVAILSSRLPEIDRAIEGAMENWRLERLSRVDRSVLRLAVGELLFSESVPPKVAIQEGVRLAGQYGGEDSYRFVNGVLDAVFRAHPRDRAGA